MQEFGRMALGPVGSVVRVRTRSRNGTINVSTVTRISAKKDGSNGSTPPSSVSSQIQGARAGAVASAHLMGALSSSSSNNSSAQAEHSMPPPPPSGGPARRTYPAKASMLWDYVAARDDELTAMAGDELLIAGDYKNQGWVWGTRIAAVGGATMPYRLVPANYIQYDENNAKEPSISGQGYPSEHKARSSPLQDELKVKHAAPELVQSQVRGDQDNGGEEEAGGGGWEGGHTREELIGDESDPLLDGMWEDENGVCSVNC